ncbi:MAG: hypothetical protein H6642_16460 [Caldilineaceae bacterium]|nr:hypothetical protein [Caldilineaceae bacterium]
MTRLRTRLVNRLHPDLLFWLVFLGLNFLLFLPLYALNAESSHFLPFFQVAGTSWREWPAHLMIWRDNYDLFRVNLEIALLAVIWVYIAWLRRPVYRWIFLVIYLVALAYYLYESIMLTFYAVEPVFYSEYMMARVGIPFLLEHLRFPLLAYGGALLLIMALLGLIALLTRLLLDENVAASLSRWSRMALLALIVGLAGTTIHYRAALAQPEMVVSSLSYKLQRNVAQSLARRDETDGFDVASIYTAYDYDGLTLDETPNIYLIFVESYGSVLYKRPDYQRHYTALAQELNAALEASGWHSASGLSLSPTWGGGSWMAYTSVLFGLHIDHHPYFQMLFKRFQTERYPDLGAYLHSQGYRYDWLSSLSSELSETAWQNYERFYGTDRWLKRQDLDYVGQEYAWGPAPPDQYALNYARQQIQADGDSPYLFFFITQTSHYPWTHLPEMADEWQSLNVEPVEMLDAIDPEAMAHSARRANYLRAIEYELRVLTDFILSEESDAIFVLVGDHQPPRVSRRDDGFQTPIHIITRDEGFLDEFLAQGFTSGWTVPDSQETTRHEAIYSLLVRALVARYGAEGVTPPPYLPSGAEVNAPEIKTTTSE